MCNPFLNQDFFYIPGVQILQKNPWREREGAEQISGLTIKEEGRRSSELGEGAPPPLPLYPQVGKAQNDRNEVLWPPRSTLQHGDKNVSSKILLN